LSGSFATLLLLPSQQHKLQIGTLAGVTTFVTKANIFAVNLAILEEVGIARDAIGGDG